MIRSRCPPVPVLQQVDSFAVLKQFRSVFLVVAATLLAVVEPVSGDSLTPLVTPLVVFLIYSSVRAIEIEQVDSTAFYLPVLGLALSYVILPLTAIVVGQRLLAGPELVGVVVMVAGPATAGSALVWSRLSDSDVVLTVTIVLGSMLLAPVVTPVLVTRLLGAEVDLATRPILQELALIVGGGLILSRVVPEDAISERWMDRSSLLVVGALVYIGVASSAVTATSNDLIGLVAATTLILCLVALGMAMAIGFVADLGHERARSLFFASGLKNLGIAIVVAASIPANGVVVAIVTFYVVQQLMAGVVVATADRTTAF